MFGHVQTLLDIVQELLNVFRRVFKYRLEACKSEERKTEEFKFSANQKRVLFKLEYAAKVVHILLLNYFVTGKFFRSP